MSARVKKKIIKISLDFGAVRNKPVLVIVSLKQYDLKYLSFEPVSWSSYAKHYRHTHHYKF